MKKAEVINKLCDIAGNLHCPTVDGDKLAQFSCIGLYRTSENSSANYHQSYANR